MSTAPPIAHPFSPGWCFLFGFQRVCGGGGGGWFGTVRKPPRAPPRPLLPDREGYAKATFQRLEMDFSAGFLDVEMVPIGHLKALALLLGVAPSGGKVAGSDVFSVVFSSMCSCVWGLILQSCETTSIEGTHAFLQEPQTLWCDGGRMCLMSVVFEPGLFCCSVVFFRCFRATHQS